MSEQKAKFGLRQAAALAALALLFVIVWQSGLIGLLRFETLAENRMRLADFVASQPASAVLAFVLIYIAAVALSLPGGALLTMTGGFLFGWLFGGLLAVLSATIGASIIFLIAKSALGETLAARAGPRLAQLRAGFANNAFSYLLFLRLVPAFPFWLVNLAPAFLGVAWPVFALATAIGIIPGTFAFAFFGAGLDDIITYQLSARDACLAAGGSDCPLRFDPAGLLSLPLLAAFVLMGVAALLPILLKSRREKRG